MHYTLAYAHKDNPYDMLRERDEYHQWHKENRAFIRKNLTIEDERVIADSFEVEEQFRFEKCIDSFENFALRLERYPPDALILSARKDGAEPYFHKRRADDFEAVAQDVLSLDIDGMPLLDGFTREDLLNDPQQVLVAHVDELLFGIDASWIAMPSSSCGFRSKGKSVLRFHLHVKLDKNYPVQSLHRMMHTIGENRPFVDPAMKEHSQLLVTSRPKMNVVDPFKRRRAFHHRGSVDLAFKDGRENYVEAEIPAMRGSRSGLYRVNADRIAAHEHVSEEARNFTLSLKSKYPEMTWPDAYAYVFNAFKAAGATSETFARLSEDRDKHGLGKQWSLSVAARLFENASPNGGRVIHAAPAYVEPEIMASQAYAQLAKAVASAHDGKHLFVVPTGVGKTELITRHVAENPHKQFVILTTNHERCDELRDRLEDARLEALEYYTWETFPSMDEQRDSSLFRSWQVWRGRLRLCERPEDVERVQRAHLNVAEHLCVSCPFYNACGYTTQVQNTWRHNWIAPVSMITNNVRILNEADTVIIDEGVVDQLIGGRHFDLSELRYKRGGKRLMDLSERAHHHLVYGGDALSEDDLEEALVLERDLHPAVCADGSMTSEEIAKSTKMDGYHPNLVSLWRALVAGPNAVHVYQLSEEVDGQDVVRDMCRTAFKRSARIKEKNVLIFDATPNDIAVQAHFSGIEIHRFEARVQNVHVRQVINNSGVKSEFLNTWREPDEGEDKTAWLKQEEKKKAKRDRLVAWLNVQPGRTVLICKKALREHLEAYDLPNVAFGHHGAIEGQDVWAFGDEMVKGAEIDNLVIIGRSLPPPWEVEAIARQHHCDDEDPIVECQGKVGRMPWYEDDYKVIAGDVAGILPVHPDARANAVLENIWKHGLEQAFGRGRGARRERRLRVLVMHNMPIDVEVHECVKMGRLSATVGDVTLLSPKEIERVFGYSGRYIREERIEPTHKYWTAEGQTKAYLASVTPEIDAEECLKMLGALRVADC